VTVADAIEMTRVENDALGGEDPNGSTSPFSPDGQQFIVITHRGNIERNTNEYTLLLFRTKDLVRNRKPEALLTMSSSSNREAITHLKWLDDSETVVFLGENPGELPEVWSFNIRNRGLSKLTQHPAPIVSYDISSDGREIVYQAEARRTADDDRIKRHGVVITTQSAPSLLACACDRDQRFNRASLELFVQKTRRPAVKINSADFLSEYAPLSLSPSGRYALLDVYVRDIPRSWAEYQEKILHGYIVGQPRPGVWVNVRRYMLLDLASLRLVPLLDTPMSLLNEGFAWAKDGNSVVVSGAYLPLNVADPIERDARAKHTWLVEVTLPAREIAKITDQSLAVLRWDQRTGHVLLAPESGSESQNLPSEAYEKTGSDWKPVPVSEDNARSRNPLDLTIEEDLNKPPEIFASNPKNHRKTLLLDLNPQFAALQFGRVEAVDWKSSDGHLVFGGLYLPPDYKAGTRYPLVIQTHGSPPSRWRLEESSCFKWVLRMIRARKQNMH
jgi:dipeptidyl aminopeptidase/acylaminoacyl peptidase